MRIWVDADACPQVIKEILFRAAERAQVLTTLVANTTLRVQKGPRLRQNGDRHPHTDVGEPSTTFACGDQLLGPRPCSVIKKPPRRVCAAGG